MTWMLVGPVAVTNVGSASTGSGGAEQIYERHILGLSTRRIVAELTSPGPDAAAPRFAHLDRGTVMRDIADERQRRVEKDGEKSEEYRADAIAAYGLIKQRALADESGSHLLEAIKAQERIDRIRGIDQPVKLDAGLNLLWSRIDGGLIPAMKQVGSSDEK